jgi:hypothetical protein
MNEIIITTVICCPVCKFKSELRMIPNESKVFHFCEECGAKLKPRPGDCCVYKSFGTVPCVSVQEGKAGGCKT